MKDIIAVIREGLAAGEAEEVETPEGAKVTDIVTQGWVQVDNKWYMINAAGDILTGWVNDGKGWVYLSPTDGVMETGLVKDGKNSYYMADNGYMVTGWFKIDEKWHYFNANGSMASNTVINGYKLDENGVWVI